MDEGTAAIQTDETEVREATRSSEPSPPPAVPRPNQPTRWQPVRRFTTPGTDAYDTVDWVEREALIGSPDSPAFHRTGLSFPTGWSQTAVNIVGSKYLRAEPTDEHPRESSLRDLIERVAGSIVTWGAEDGYFDDQDAADTFAEELRWLLLHQRAAFNSPVWFNIGVAGVPQQASACFILSVDDNLNSILDWFGDEGRIFKGGSGAGTNLSKVRAAGEPLSGGGTASGPLSFMRGADASAGAIKSGGKTRRAAKMVLLDDDHPDVLPFIRCKEHEEQRAEALSDAGFDVGLNGVDAEAVAYQNANHSVRLSDEFMRAVESDGTWTLRRRADGEPAGEMPARKLLHEIAEAAWRCADPGVQFSDTINSWHTCPDDGPINASNPCSEYVHLDDSACNLASLNLSAFLDPDHGFDAEGLAHAAEVMFVAQDILVGHADYPTERIGERARAYRQLGLGVTALGSLLMAVGVPYDSPDGRTVAAAVTALVGGSAYRTSARLAATVGPFDRFAANALAVAGVLKRHRNALDEVGELTGNAPPVARAIASTCAAAAGDAWQEAVESCKVVGVRNAQATVAAPTGTISFMMDASSTGIEPEIALARRKQLVGGGEVASVADSVADGLRTLGYTDTQVQAAVDVAADGGSLAEMVDDQHLPVFATALDTANPISPSGHIQMMAAIQPFLSGAISKTVNLPSTATVDDIEQLFTDSWQLGIKAVAVYRDASKVTQPVSAVARDDTDDSTAAEQSGTTADDVSLYSPPPARRHRLARSRPAQVTSFTVGGCKGYMTVGEYPDGAPGEIFLTVAKQGSTISGMIDAFAIQVSQGLQHGVPLADCLAPMLSTQFAPAGITDDPEIRFASSVPDYVARRLALDYLPVDQQQALHVHPTPSAGTAGTAVPAASDQRDATAPSAAVAFDGPVCGTCGSVMTRAGSCHTCSTCGASTGCG